jgi:3-dehydroquinate dehydratase/shikimate dehydrogenase
VLSRALELGAEFVDVEWRTLREAGGVGGFDGLLHADRRRIIVSSHDFSGVSGDLCGQARAMRSTGAAVIKVAVTPGRLSDTLPLRDVAREGDAVVIGMGDAGVPTRLLATRFGSRWTYGGKGLAPGQVASARMLREFRFRTVGDQTLVFGVVGNDVMHSLSPAIHNAAFAAAGLDAVCVPLLASGFEDFVTFAEALRVVGASVATPYLPDAFTVSIRSDETARRAGVANTIRRAADGWEATYTGAVVGPRDLPPASQSQDDIDTLVAEAERQFEWWTGRSPAVGVMRAAALAETGHRDTEAQRRT